MCSDPQPDFVIYREPGTGKPDFIVLEVKLPGVVSTLYLSYYSVLSAHGFCSILLSM